MVESPKERVAALVSIHVVAKELDKSLRTLRTWCQTGMKVPLGRLAALKKADFQIRNGRIRLWRRRVGNDVRTTWEEVDRFLAATGDRP